MENVFYVECVFYSMCSLHFSPPILSLVSRQLSMCVLHSSLTRWACPGQIRFVPPWRKEQEEEEGQWKERRTFIQLDAAVKVASIACVPRSEIRCDVKRRRSNIEGPRAHKGAQFYSYTSTFKQPSIKSLQLSKASPSFTSNIFLVYTVENPNRVAVSKNATRSFPQSEATSLTSCSVWYFGNPVCAHTSYELLYFFMYKSNECLLISDGVWLKRRSVSFVESPSWNFGVRSHKLFGARTFGFVHSLPDTLRTGPRHLYCLWTND